MKLRVLVLLIIAFAFAQSAKADSGYSYALGVSMQNTVVPGSQVTIDGFLLNTGTNAIHFASNFGGTPSQAGGSEAGAGVSADGQWSILSNGFSMGNFNSQFAGVTVNPGQDFQFTLGTFTAPTSQPMGTSATPQINLVIDFTDSITGDLLENCKSTCSFDDAPMPSFTLGNHGSSSGVTFFQGDVVDSSVSMPESSSYSMLLMTMILTAFVAYLSRKRLAVFTAAH